MPKLKLTKSAIDALAPDAKDAVYWDTAQPGFGIKVTPAGRKVFIALYRTQGGRSRLRKYTIGPHGRITLHHARAAAQRIFAARLDGRDPAAEKLELRRRQVVDRVDDLVEAFIAEHLSRIRSGAAVARKLRSEVVPVWGSRSVHEIKRREISELVFEAAVQRAPYSAHRLLKALKRFFSWCLERAILESSPAVGIRSPVKNTSRDRVLSDDELARVVNAARAMGGSYGSVVEFLALTGQRREEVNQMSWDELNLDQAIWNLPASRAKNGRGHIVHLSAQALAVLRRQHSGGPYVFSTTKRPFQGFGHIKRQLDALRGEQLEAPRPTANVRLGNGTSRDCPACRGQESLITNPARSQAWRRSISGTTSSLSGRTPSSAGARMLLAFARRKKPCLPTYLRLCSRNTRSLHD